MPRDRHDRDFTDVLQTPEEILDEPRFLSYTAHFWEAPDGELYFRPWREFLKWPGRGGLHRVDGPEDARLIFNLLKLRNILSFTLLFMLLGGGLVLLGIDAVRVDRVWPDAAVALASMVGAFIACLVPINLWCLLLFQRQIRQRRETRRSGAGRPVTVGGGR